MHLTMSSSLLTITGAIKLNTHILITNFKFKNNARAKSK